MAEQSAASTTMDGDLPKTRAQSSSHEVDASMTDSSTKSKEKEEEASSSSSEICPLFMDGLPSDFSKNTGLAAIASLLNEDDDHNNHEEESNCKSDNVGPQLTVTLKTGGGKVRKKTTSKRSNHSPYSKQKNGKNEDDNKKKKASLGEAQLFLNMWKI